MSPPAPLGLSAWLALIIDGLCAAVAARAPRNPAAPLLMLAYRRLRRVLLRFTRLLEQAAAGTRPLRQVRPARPARAARARPELRLPSGFAWLVQLVPEAAAFGSQLRHLLLQPEMVALIAAAPEAGRLFGPLGRMLAVQMGTHSPKPARVRAAVPLSGPLAGPLSGPHAAVPAATGSGAGIFAGKVIPEWARNAWPGHDFAGREPPPRAPQSAGRAGALRPGRRPPAPGR